MQISKGKIVSIHYTLTDKDGTEIDSSTEGDGLVYLHGTQNIIPGLESALVGKVSGDELKVSIEPKDGYGERDDALVEQVPRDRFPDTNSIELGMQFQTETADGHAVVVTVMQVDDEQVTVDANHPLAGVQLNFDVKVLEVREATEEEISHGHVHGPGGHHH
ncbi:MAG: peptidylprolyl isomerase [Gammaproteobacteria bacterium]|nr:peptidylprolyl isomerase [Gammaproteobacteria bacterium]